MSHSNLTAIKIITKNIKRLNYTIRTTLRQIRNLQKTLSPTRTHTAKYNYKNKKLKLVKYPKPRGLFSNFIFLIFLNGQ